MPAPHASIRLGVEVWGGSQSGSAADPILPEIAVFHTCPEDNIPRVVFSVR
jgi:hypothetical protein